MRSSETYSGEWVPGRERDRVRGPAGHDQVAFARTKMKLGEERPVAELGHEHPHDLGTEGLDELAHEVVAHRAGRLDALEGEGDGGRLRSADEDRQRATSAFGLFEQHDRACSTPGRLGRPSGAPRP